MVHPGTNAIVWRWDLTGSAFGEHAAQTNPDGDANTYTFNLRYPGQYLDTETGLHYNYFRDYEPGTGRYVQSDPIGLAAGTSTFGYVRGNPLGSSDPYGLWDNVARYACARECRFMHQFSFQGSMGEVMVDRYADKIGTALLGSVSSAAKAFGKATTGVEQTAASPAGMSDLFINDPLLEQCAGYDGAFEAIYKKRGHRSGDWLTVDQATALLNAFREEVDSQMRRACAGPHDSACVAPFRSIKNFYGLGNKNVDGLLLRAQGRMDSTSQFILRANPPPGQ